MRAMSSMVNERDVWRMENALWCLRASAVMLRTTVGLSRRERIRGRRADRV